MVPVDNDNFDWNKFFNECNSLVDSKKNNKTKEKGKLELDRDKKKEKGQSIYVKQKGNLRPKSRV